MHKRTLKAHLTAVLPWFCLCRICLYTVLIQKKERCSTAGIGRTAKVEGKKRVVLTVRYRWRTLWLKGGDHHLYPSKAQFMLHNRSHHTYIQIVIILYKPLWHPCGVFLPPMLAPCTSRPQGTTLPCYGTTPQHIHNNLLAQGTHSG